jgi:hypothetical protein
MSTAASRRIAASIEKWQGSITPAERAELIAMLTPPPMDRSLRGRIGAHASWATTDDRSARTKNGRDSFDRKFLEAANGDEAQAAVLRGEYFSELARRGHEQRNNKKRPRPTSR